MLDEAAAWVGNASDAAFRAAVPLHLTWFAVSLRTVYNTIHLFVEHMEA